MFFGRRAFLKNLAWLFGSSQLTPVLGEATTASAAPVPAEQLAGRNEAGVTLVPGEFDVIVVGGGISGTTCAISAARNGAKVALVHERSMLGGNSSSEVRLYPEGNDAYQPWIRESGIHDEFHVEDRVRNHVVYREGLMNSIWDLVLYERCILEKNLTLFLNTHMHAVQMANPNQIKSIKAIQLGTEKTFELTAPIFVDCTGDGVLGYRAGADFRWGREGKNEYNESLAPDQPDEKVMGNTLFFRAYDTGHPVPFKRPEWAAEFKDEKELSFRGHQNLEAGHWWIEIGAPHHPIHGNEEIRHECLRQLLGVWDHVKNKGDHGAENYALDFVGFWPYKRESRRIIGDAVLTQQQVQDPKVGEDDVAYGAWGIDLHFPGGILNRHERPYIPPHGSNFEKFGTLPYGISLRSLYSRNIENLMMAGRPISASYLGFCSSRVLSTGCIVGQAVGVAAALSARYKKPPQQIAKDHAQECQQLILKQDGHIIGVENEDPADLARSATATASSEAPLQFPEPKTPRELSIPRAQLFPMSEDRIDTVSLWLESKRTEPFELQLGLRPANHVWDFRAADDLATAKATIPAKHAGWIDFAFNTKVDPRKLYFVHAPAAKQIYWSSVDHPRSVP
ncbi:MAG TPA: FAD-dependent oxidoreductase, partial [Tepidisphaeraceae bacterium]|nr:FAD-dependent oxidoreductase [Tepidisphaeraceae bacterium]